MNGRRVLLVAIAFLFLLVVGCAGGGGAAVSPSIDEEPAQGLTASADQITQVGANLWGYYDLYLDIENKTIEAIPNRSNEFAANVVKFLNNDPQGLKVKSNGVTPGPGYVDIDMDITIKHPLSTHEYDGYDVRGIFIGNGSATLDYNADLIYPVGGTDQILLNADGYSRWFNPGEFPVPKIFGYVPGKLAPAGYAGTATLNPYRYFGEGLSATDSLWSYLSSGNEKVGYFLAGTSNTRNYKIRFPVPLPGVKYGYAVVANWKGVAPQDHPAYAPEAVATTVSDNSTLYYVDEQTNGGSLVLDITIFDWDAELTGGVMEDYHIKVESTVQTSSYGLDSSQMTPTASGDHWYTYHVEIPADNVSGIEGNEMWIVVEDSNADYTNPLGVPNTADGDKLAACFRYPLTVSNEEPPWIELAVPNGGENWIIGGSADIQWTSHAAVTNVKIELSLNSGADYTLVITPSTPNPGTFTWNPIPSEAESNTCRIRVSDADNPDIYDESDTDFRILEPGIIVTQPNGGEEWAVGGSGEITWDSFGVTGNVNIYYSKDNFDADIHPIVSDELNDGSFVWQSIPDDPSTTVRVKVELSGDPGTYDISDNDFSLVTGWARTWGGDGSLYGDQARASAIDGSGNVYVTGEFDSAVDFDPGPDADTHLSAGGSDVFLSKFDSAGTFLWARPWGGVDYEVGIGVTVDALGNVYVTGGFMGTVDFDPGSGVDEHTSAGSNDVFLSKLDGSGNFLWALTWGSSGVYGDGGHGVSVDGSNNILVAGMFDGTADFDPGPSVDEHASAGNHDIFLSKFDGSGNFVRAQTWGGSEDDWGNGVALDGSGNSFVIGVFSGTADFDPGASLDEHVSIGDQDIFLSKFDSGGDFAWARTWGGTDPDTGTSVAADGSGNVYVTGFFRQTVDFDPGPGVDEHTPAVSQFDDVFLSKFDSGGNFIRALTWGGSFPDRGQGVAVDGYDNVYVAGTFAMTADFDPGPGEDSHTALGESDAFLSALDIDGNFLWARTWGGTSVDFATGVATDDIGDACATGSFYGTVDFDPGPGVDEHTCTAGEWDSYVDKFPPGGNW